MKSKEFLQEALNSPGCPKNFEQIYLNFQKYQKAAMDTLIEFHRVCELNHINYQLAFGSLLGAIRDGGQIPWDYDIDVFVSYEDKMKLVNALKKDLNENFYFYCPEVDEKCRHSIMRLAPKGYHTEVLHVDVFYYVGTPNDPDERKQYTERIRDLSKARFGKLVKPMEASGGSAYHFLGLMKKKWKYRKFNLNEIDDEYKKLCSLYPVADSDFVVSADIFSTLCDFPREVFDETILYGTDCGEFRISAKYADILTLRYGDYNSVPAIDARIREVQMHYKRLTYFDKKK